MNRCFRALFTLAVLLVTSTLQAATIQGVVISTGGHAISGAKVQAFTFESPEEMQKRVAGGQPDRKAVAEAATDAKGKFTVDVGKLAAVQINVTAEGFAPAGGEVAAGDDAGVIALAPAADVRGRITANGKPVSGARIELSGDGGSLTRNTDEKGEYVVPDPSKWVGRVTIDHPDYAPFEKNARPGREKMPGDHLLRSGVSITGKVFAADGKTAAAGVDLYVDGRFAGRSGEDGTFTVSHAPEQWRTIEARTSDQIALYTRQASTSVVLTLRRGSILTGVVKDGATGRELVGASVSIRDAAERFVEGHASRAAFTDQKGRYRVGPLMPGSYALYGSFPGYLAFDDQIALKEPTAVDRTLTLARGSWIEGYVRDEGKGAVAGALVRAQFVPGQRRTLFFESAWSGPDGRFVLGPISSTTSLALYTTKKGFPEGRVAGVSVGSAERKRDVVITIPGGVAVPVRVTDAEGRPVAGATIAAREPDEGRFGGPQRIFFEDRGVELPATGRDGIAELRLKQGKYDFTAKAPGFAAKEAVGVQVAERMEPVEIVLTPGVQIQGRVITASGSPVEGASVSIPSSRRDIESAITGPDGSFALVDLEPGEVMLWVTKTELFLRMQEMVKAPSKDVIIEVPAGGRISGRVIDKATKKPITDFSAGISGERGNSAMRMFGPPQLRTFHSEDGTFALDHVPPGRLNIIAVAPGYVRGELPAVEVIDGKSVEELEIALEAGVRVVGKVTGPDDSPLSGVSVTARSEGERRGFSLNEGAQTDAAGEYALEGIEGGEKVVSFDKEGFVSERKTTKLSGKEVRVDARLSRGLEISGTVVSESGSPVADATVNASASRGGDEVQTDANGAFRFSGLEPGRYNISARKSGYPTKTIRDVDVASTPNLRIVLDAGGVIYGRVTGMAPEDARHVRVSAQGGGSWTEARLDSAGNFRMEGAPVGSVSVSAAIERPGGYTTSEQKRVEVAAGATVQVDLAFGVGSSVEGRVTRDGRPVSSARVMARPKDRRISTQGSAVSSSDGTFSISGLQDGEYDIVAMDMTTLVSFTTNCLVSGASRCDVEMRDSPLRGTVLDASTGEPIAGASITVVQPGVNRYPLSATSDTRGTFVLESVAPGAYQARAEKKGYGQQVLDLNVTDSAPQELNFRLSASDGVRVRIFDARDGRTLAGGLMAIDSAGRIAGDGFTTGSDAGYALSLAPGVYRLVVTSGGYAPQSVRISVPSSDVRIGLTPGGRLIVRSSSAKNETGRILLPSGEVFLRGRWDPTGLTVFGPGETVYQNVAAGTYTLVIDGDGAGAKVTKQFTVVEGQTTEVAF